MYFTDGLEDAREHARAALNMMELHRIPTTPMNFAIWYAYHSGGHPDLRRELEALLANMTGITAQRSEELFDRHFGFGREGAAVREAGARIRGTMARVLAALETAGGDAGAVRDELAALNGQLEDRFHDAMTDRLTGLANRKAFELGLREAVAGVWRARGGLSLLYADIDRFQTFNERHGRPIGDQVLRAIGRALKVAVNDRGSLARHGGAAFAAILPETGLADALDLAERIRALLASQELRNLVSGQNYGTLTLSLGVAEYRLGEPIGVWLRRAGQALARAKAAGRNRVMADRAPDADVDLAG